MSVNSIFLLKMSSFKQVQDDMLICYCENIISDEEYFILSGLYRSNNLDLPYDEYPLFDLESMSNDECITEFRFEKSHLPLLADVLQIPPMFKCPQGSVVDGMEALCMLLKRLSYPCRYADMVHRFGRPIPVLSMVTNQVLDFIYDTHGRRILQWNHDLLNPRSLEEYTYAVSRKGAPLDNCFGFVDGTVRPITRPGENQRVLYNGHKRVHAIKFQSVALPNGLVANMFGPVGKYDLTFCQ